MAWSAPMTATVGSVFTAAQFNSNVRDNLNALRDGFVYAQITADVTVSNSNIDIVSSGALTYAATPHLFTFGTPRVELPAATGMNLILYDDATAVAVIGRVNNAGAANHQVPVEKSIKLTPTAASHTYKIVAIGDNATAGQIVNAGTGTGGAYAPAFIRITLA